MYSTIDSRDRGCLEHGDRIADTSRGQLSSHRRVCHWVPSRVCPPNPSPVRVREPEIHSCWIRHQEEKTQVQGLSVCLMGRGLILTGCRVSWTMKCCFLFLLQEPKLYSSPHWFEFDSRKLQICYELHEGV